MTYVYLYDDIGMDVSAAWISIEEIKVQICKKKYEQQFFFLHSVLLNLLDVI